MMEQKENLFLGFKLTNSIKQRLDQIDKKVLSLFINEDNHYLQTITINKDQYLGKNLGPISNLNIIELTMQNIISITTQSLNLNKNEINLALIAE